MENILAGESKLTQSWIRRAHSALNDARLLFQMGGDNGSIVNRAYYSMLYAVFAALVPYHINKRVDYDDHIIASFDDKFVRSNIISNEMSKKIHNAFDLCQACDFQDFFAISKEHAAETLNSADEFIRIIEEKLSNQP